MGKNWSGGGNVGAWCSPALVGYISSRTGEQRDASLIPGEPGAPCAPASVQMACPWVLGPISRLSPWWKEPAEKRVILQ